MFSSIVVPLDGSVSGNGALPMATALAMRSDAALHLVHVCDPVTVSAAGPIGTLPLGTDEPRRRAEMEGIAARLARAHALRVTAEVLAGPIVPALQRYLDDGGHDLAVLMSHGGDGPGRARLGSVADGLVRHAHVPMLLLRPGLVLAHEAVEPLFHRVVVPLDGSARAESVLDHVVAFGIPDVTEYVMLTIIPPSRSSWTSGGGGEAEGERSYDERQREAAFEYLNGAAGELRSTGAVVTLRVDARQHRAEGILDAAVELRADLIALSTRGRGGVSRHIHDSVADKVIRGATTAVLVHHPSPPGAASPAAAGTMASAAAR